MEAGLVDCTAVLRPGERIDVVGYGCTSGAMVIGPENVVARVHEARPGIPVHEPVHGGTHGTWSDGGAPRRAADALCRRGQPGNAPRAPGGGARGTRDGLVQPPRRQRRRPHQRSLDRRRPRGHGIGPAVDGAFVACTSLRVCGIVERAEQRVESRSRHRTMPSPGTAYGSPGSATRPTGSAASSGPSSQCGGQLGRSRSAVARPSRELTT